VLRGRVREFLTGQVTETPAAADRLDGALGAATVSSLGPLY
jgi:hypothetical protein